MTERGSAKGRVAAGGWDVLQLPYSLGPSWPCVVVSLCILFSVPCGFPYYCEVCFAYQFLFECEFIWRSFSVNKLIFLTILHYWSISFISYMNSRLWGGKPVCSSGDLERMLTPMRVGWGSVRPNTRVGGLNSWWVWISEGSGITSLRCGGHLDLQHFQVETLISSEFPSHFSHHMWTFTFHFYIFCIFCTIIFFFQLFQFFLFLFVFLFSRVLKAWHQCTEILRSVKNIDVSQTFWVMLCDLFIVYANFWYLILHSFRV